MMRMSHFTLTALVAGALLGAAAACTGSSTGSGATGGTAPTGTTGLGIGAGPSVTTSHASSPTSPTGSGGRTSSGSGVRTGAGTVACTGPLIQVTVKNAGIAMNHFGRVLIFTNDGRSACTMRGYPGAAVTKGSTILLNATRSLSGYLADDPAITDIPVITLAPGGSASAMLEWEGDAGEACYADGTGTFDVTPPNTAGTSSFGTLTLGTKGICADFEVHPVTSGILPYIP